jgi:hypothetical protein
LRKKRLIIAIKKYFRVREKEQNKFTGRKVNFGMGMKWLWIYLFVPESGVFHYK